MALRTWRIIGAIGLLLGLGSLLIVTPLQWAWGQASAPTVVASAHPHTWALAGVLAVFGPAAWVLGIVAVTALARHRGWVLTTVGGVASILALTCGVGHLALAFGLPADAAAAASSEREVTALLSADSANPLSTSLLLVFLVGFTIGPILLTIGLRRAGLVPVWLPVAAVIAGMANFAPGVFAGAVQLTALTATYLPLTIVLVRAARAGDPSATESARPAPEASADDFVVSPEHRRRSSTGAGETHG
jgi:hypothetical protein